MSLLSSGTHSGHPKWQQVTCDWAGGQEMDGLMGVYARGWEREEKTVTSSDNTSNISEVSKIRDMRERGCTRGGGEIK